MNGYSHVGLTRTAGKGGGVSLYIAEKLAYTDVMYANSFIPTIKRTTRVTKWQ